MLVRSMLDPFRVFRSPSPQDPPPSFSGTPAKVFFLFVLLALGLSACTDSSTDPVALQDPTPTTTSRDLAALVPPGSPDCENGTVASTGALVRACIPDEGWNGSLVVWSHGYVAPMEPLAIPDDEVGGQPVEAIVTGLGYGYATSSFRSNGLVADVAVDDLDDAVAFFEDQFGPSQHAFLVGASEGGLTAALALERNAPGYDGGMILCAPVGSFRLELQHFGDFRVLLDAYFPGLVDDGNPGTPWKPWGAGGDVMIPAGVMANWTGIEAAVGAETASHPARMAELLRVAGVAFDPDDPSTMASSAAGALWYNLFATNDLITKLGGLPYGNVLRWYRGSSNDFLLNRRVQRIAASASALAQLARFETRGSLKVPGVGMHTTLDPIVPLSQGLTYRFKTLLAGIGFRYNFIPIQAYGHCAFQAPQVLAGFALTVLKATGWELVASSSLFRDSAEETMFLSTARELGANPTVEGRRRHP